jgi:outer membrane murein-binding lipoprotein Lpp
MMDSECARCLALLESIQATVHAVAEGQVALVECCDRIDVRLDRVAVRIEQVTSQVATINAKVVGIGIQLDAFSASTQSRLERIETRTRFLRRSR